MVDGKREFRLKRKGNIAIIIVIVAFIRDRPSELSVGLCVSLSVLESRYKPAVTSARERERETGNIPE